MENKQRVIQESVPGRQVTIAHIIANPDQKVYEKIGLLEFQHQALGILTITPSEAAIVASDIATKTAAVQIAFMDRFSGAVVMAGDVMAVEAGISAVIETLDSLLKIRGVKITRS
ncbi:BMC domain-containing protein [Vagococcus sp. BWB3-3]|uniref:BMC domain-containing protein n=1 Tax=Vagococcus allomyrinae TaxID=2794353 RepID=A0A940SRI1_9ENTE|nr:BMC domain-containing protein [Vagococcus allomyrinae]MBP1040842.1 BMC domain-containing protein [Vagococcus allomyrinae]